MRLDRFLKYVGVIEQAQKLHLHQNDVHAHRKGSSTVQLSLMFSLLRTALLRYLLSGYLLHAFRLPVLSDLRLPLVRTCSVSQTCGYFFPNPCQDPRSRLYPPRNLIFRQLLRVPLTIPLYLHVSVSVLGVMFPLVIPAIRFYRFLSFPCPRFLDTS
jgi:hypothetical protein